MEDEKYFERQRERERIALQLAQDFNHYLLDTQHIKDDRWEAMRALFNKTVGIKARNQVVRFITKYTDDYIGFIRYVNFSNKLIIGEQACNGERTVIVFGDKVYDLLANINGMLVKDYTIFLSKYNTLIGVDKSRSRYAPYFDNAKGYNNEQWELLCNDKKNIGFAELISANTKW